MTTPDPTPKQVAQDLETADNDVRRAVSTWAGCDVAALVEDGGDESPVTELGEVVESNDLDASEYVLYEVNLT